MPSEPKEHPSTHEPSTLWVPTSGGDETITPSGRNRTIVLEEYKYLSKLEQSTTKMRHTTFTALISISFVVTGIAFRGDTTETVQLPLFGSVRVAGLAAIFGFMFYCFSVTHYVWYHRYSHLYRDSLKSLEVDLGISVYRNRKRPTMKRAKFHFDWTLYIIGVFYFLATAEFAGWALCLAVCAAAIGMYCVMLLWSIRWDEEPLEGGHL